ncbi:MULTISPECIES: hypothetical protein [unclassified Rhizobium]|uniref:hypothetical protein n=1 Tax=unclassified Rhizobium TaxID=2613769 RepID=UPI000EA97C70|nr:MULTISPECIES: hypothetical protein [unclassified Rhizobium]AYG69131.1 hypothetical protein CCGE531_24130 [Rhizobium sp. CCGE531]AYG75511.1 hypothetical protein CCGE532_23635 [Rhizobium sp. CCGE532]
MGKVLDFPVARSADALRAIRTGPVGKTGGLIDAEMFPRAILLLARSFVAVYEASPRTAALFATQQRWLLCHAALGDYFRSVRTARRGVSRRSLGNLALQYGIASRNTAYAFFDEALKYDVVRPIADGQSDQVAPAPLTLLMLTHWYSVHFQALDLIDGGSRAARFLSEPENLVMLIQPLAAHALLTSPVIRSPGPLYTIFTWADAGGLLMDRLIAGIEPEMLGQDRLLTDVSSISYLAQSFGLSRAHTSRKFAAAESIGGIGWSGRRGRSRIWISHGFYEEYAHAHASKLDILDDAFTEASTVLVPLSEKSVATDDI